MHRLRDRFGQPSSTARRVVALAGYRGASRMSRTAAVAFTALALSGFASPLAGQPAPSQRGEPSTDGRVTVGGHCMNGHLPIVGARLRLLRIYSSSESLELVALARSRADGQFTFADVPVQPTEDSTISWRYAIMATAPARGSALRFVESHSDVRLKMPPAATLHGRVTDGEGRPVGGASVWAMAPVDDPVDGIMAATTDADGRFEITDMPKSDGIEPGPNGVEFHITSYLRADHPKFGRSLAPYRGTPGEVNIVMQLGSTIRGMVFDEVRGPPADGVVVSMQAVGDHADAFNRGIVGWRQTRTDAQGRYEIPSVAPGVYNIWADAKDRTCAAVDSLEIVAGEPIQVPPLRLVEGGWIEGEVLDARGAPLSTGANGRPLRVTLQGPSRPTSGTGRHSVPVDADGSFRLRAAPGENLVNVVHLSDDEQAEAPRSIRVENGRTVRVLFRVTPSRSALRRMQRESRQTSSAG